MPSDVIEQLRRAALIRDRADLTDGQLLSCFVEHRDEDAFAALVRRHGPMVWGVCRRVLAHDPDAEDAFQATFLVLVRKAAGVVPREMVGNWLYGVAHQAALKARRAVVRRREKQVAVPERPVTDPDPGDDLRPLLDQELSRLPDKYRVVVVLCDLEGKTREAAARQLGWPEGTVAGRLARAREMLATRLARRGVTPSGVAGLVPAVVPGIVVPSTIQAANQTAATSARVAVLIQGVLNAMFVTKLKTAAVVVAMLGATLTCGMLAGMGDKGDPVTLAKTFAPAPADRKADALRRERKKFEGTWRCVSMEVNGKKLADGTFGGIVVFDAEGRWKDRVERGTTVYEGASEIDPLTNPRTIRSTVTSEGNEKGKTFRKVYEFTGADSFRWSPYPSEKDRPTEFPRPGTKRSLQVWQRVKKPELLDGIVKKIDDKSITLTSGERVTLDEKTKYTRETERDAAPAERADVTKGKAVSIWTRKQGEKLVAVWVVLARVQPPGAKEDSKGAGVKKGDQGTDGPAVNGVPGPDAAAGGGQIVVYGILESVDAEKGTITVRGVNGSDPALGGDFNPDNYPKLVNVPVRSGATRVRSSGVGVVTEKLQLKELVPGQVVSLRLASDRTNGFVVVFARVGSEAADPKPGGHAKKEVAGLAKEIAEMKIVRHYKENVSGRPAENTTKTIKDKAKVAQVLALFPEVGTKEKPDDEGGRGYIAAYSITLYPEKGDPFHLWISHDRKFWSWSQGANASPGDWHMKKAKEVGKLLDALLK